MRVIKSIKKIRNLIAETKAAGKTIGFVPTMGALHAGHASLLKKCRRENDLVVLSIFVNPKQFSPSEDFKAYPRGEKEDKSLAQKEKVDIIFYPSAEEIYPDDYLTSINVEKISQILCGRSRPGHFQGVATVVAKFLNIITPNILYLGQKDAQQVAVIKKMVTDLNIPVKIKICPTIREKNGLALSSRNKYLTEEQEKEAPILYQSLQQARKEILNGNRDTQKIMGNINSKIKTNSCGKIDYIQCVDACSFKAVKTIQSSVLILLAVWFGKARLIDNISVNIK